MSQSRVYRIRFSSLVTTAIYIALGIAFYNSGLAVADDASTTSPVAQPATQPAKLPRAIGSAEIIVIDEKPQNMTAVSPSTGEVTLDWPKVPNTAGYIVFRSDQPKIQLGWGPMMKGQSKSNHYSDAEVKRDTRYYYAIVTAGRPNLLVATGSCATLAVDAPLIGTEEPSTKP